MKKLCTLALLCTISTVHAGALEKRVAVTHEKSASAFFSEERYNELHKVRGTILAATILPNQKQLALMLHNVWCSSRVQFNQLTQHTQEANASFEPVLRSLASVDQTIFDTLKEFEKNITSKKEEMKS